MKSDSATPLAGRIALVTGATRGIGEAIAVGLAKAGAHVIALGRTQGALEALDDTIFAATGEHATLVPLDLREADGLDQLAAALQARFGKLDILVGAAGVLGALTPVGHLDPKGWDMIMATNLTANWRLIRAMDPLLRRADAGRAIFITSSVAKSHRAFWGGYAASKAGLEAIVGCYNDEMENTTVRALCVDPGAMRTRMRAGAFPGEDPLSVPAPDTLAPLIVELARADREPPRGVVVFKARGQESASIG
ncbi:MAG: SDR family NAD(P)-dependent oxidoreductase [Gemmatimonadaceae bacterium]|uniref:SDR family NAD(P)-dependent oxidoreductase n=1 Tax=Caulobacter sp. DWP3-1-3b2 TaxID=2804643 RepID=UPI0019C7EE21|nr:SDR family NAD(P)-dependent oxidoreductase [Caulobacter sp.]